jgi:chemotaxis signal transduction protein
MTELYVRVRVADEQYALSVADVLEVCALGEITPVPGASGAVLGVTNLGGTVMAVADLAVVLGLAGGTGGDRIVVASEGARRAGLVVDSIIGVEGLPELASTEHSSHLLGAAVLDGSLVGVIDVKSVLDEIQQRRVLA